MWVWRNDNALGDPSETTHVNTALDRIDYLINYSTLCVRVSPKMSVDAALTFDVTHKGTSFKLGYHAYARPQEKLKLRSTIAEPIGLSAISNYLDRWREDSPKPKTYSANTPDGRTFGAQPLVVDYTYTPTAEQKYAPTYTRITAQDLDLASGSVPAQLIHSLYASLGHQWEAKVPVGLFAGFSYDISTDRNSYNKWLAWLHCSIEF
jgi:hypothetical protein